MERNRWCSQFEPTPVGTYRAVTRDLARGLAGVPIATAQLCTSCSVDIMVAGMHHL